MNSNKIIPDEKLQDTRKPYKKPQIEHVLLVPEEAVLGGCKIASVFGMTEVGCQLPAGCSEPGS